MSSIKEHLEKVNMQMNALKQEHIFEPNESVMLGSIVYAIQEFTNLVRKRKDYADK